MDEHNIEVENGKVKVKNGEVKINLLKKDVKQAKIKVGELIKEQHFKRIEEEFALPMSILELIRIDKYFNLY